MSESIPSVVCLVGPTGAGKTAAALHLARQFGAGVINADSRQVYSDFPIITAQPSPEEQSVCPHLLYGFLDTRSRISAGIWADKAAEAIFGMHQAGMLPLLVGGTGMYLRALLEGIVDIPAIPRELHESLQQECAVLGPAALHARLATVDPAYAARIHPHDRQRVTRALEVHAHTGRTFSAWHDETMPRHDFRVLRIGFDMTLDQLTPRLGLRIDQMLAAGAVEEARAARLKCDDPAAPGWSGIGCAELYQYLTGRIALADACDLWLKNTRAYAKRQLTWFRADAAIHWHTPSDIKGMTQRVARFLSR